jgi:5-methyltetrahydrofolate--homocysteine methyltransferase
MKEELLEKIALCVEFGKINKASSYPPDMKDQDGADELTRLALESGISPSDVLNKALIVGMDRIGKKFAEQKVFVPQMLISAKAMTTAMVHIKPFFTSGALERKGTFVIGTVFGDLHDIGKNLVAMTVEGAGWEVIDLGVDVRPEKFIGAIEKHPGCVVGLSALLTTTMVNMETIVAAIRSNHPEQIILVGGAPLSIDFCSRIGATFYSSDPQGAVEYLRSIAV